MTDNSMNKDSKIASALNWLHEAVQSKDLRDGGKMHRLAVKVIEEEIDALRRELAEKDALISKMQADHKTHLGAAGSE